MFEALSHGGEVNVVRILMVYDSLYPDSVGGVEHRNFQLGRALANRGHHVTLAGWGNCPADPVISYEVLRARRSVHTADGKRSSRSALRFAADARKLKLSDFDLVETANIPYIHLPVLDWMRRRSDVPLAVTWHEYWGPYWRNYLSGWNVYKIHQQIERRVTRCGSQLLSVSEFTKKRLETDLRGSRHIEVVPNGVDVELMNRISGGASQNGSPFFVSVGRLIKEKRVDLLLRAAAKVAGRSSGPVLRIIGDGPDATRLKRIQAELGLEDSVEFVGRLNTPEEVWQSVAECRVAVTASEREGFGMFALEALSLGVPVLYADGPNSAVGEVVGTGGAGMSFEPQADVLAEAMGLTLGTHGLIEAMRDEARIRASQFDWGRIAEQFEIAVRN